ncbi:WSC domain-containing protein [Lachnellula suecica]|uniref:WSC domain-containing protein n=1 Tax=Lachnellula suecica TaxID=602035 RepID=A0A8T9CDF7_9HELO|nr:WSC domain-containing protein [Lachnellula suecica]
MRQNIATQLVLGLAFAATASAFFRLPCKSPLVTQRADPIVSPGKVSAHAHTIMGGNGFGFQMDFASTQASTCSSCTVLQDMSNYWVPTLYYKAQNGSFISVGQAGGATIYYLQRSDPTDANYPKLQAFPEGFRMLAGDPLLRNYSDTAEQNAVSFACLGTNSAQTNGFPSTKCPDGLRAQVFFPSCWNGIDLDSADHKSHVVYPSGSDHGSCPENFKHRLVSIFYEVIWNTPDFDDMWYGDGQPFVLANGDPTRFRYHGDFVNGWNVSTLQSAVDNCNDDSGVIEKCPYFDFATDNAAQACVIPPSIDDQVFGIMESLPGCNMPQEGPSKAVPQSCGATTQIGEPQLPYVDLTKSKGFAYVGCGTDPGGQPRTLQGSQINDNTGMTVEYCIDYCVSQGYIVAGLEFSTQCFCDNSIPTDRAAIPALVGNYGMPCSGHSDQICGGASLISLYQKCGESACANIELPFINGSVSALLAITPSAIETPSMTVGLSSSIPPLSTLVTSASRSSGEASLVASTPTLQATSEATAVGALSPTGSESSISTTSKTLIIHKTTEPAAGYTTVSSHHHDHTHTHHPSHPHTRRSSDISAHY